MSKIGERAIKALALSTGLLLLPIELTFASSVVEDFLMSDSSEVRLTKIGNDIYAREHVGQLITSKNTPVQEVIDLYKLLKEEKNPNQRIRFYENDDFAIYVDLSSEKKEIVDIVYYNGEKK